MPDENRKPLKYTYRESIKTPPGVADWIRESMGTASFSEFANAAFVRVMALDDGTPISDVLSRLGQSAPAARPAAPSGGVTADEIRGLLGEDGEATRSEIRELSVRIDDIADRLASGLPADAVAGADGEGMPGDAYAGLGDALHAIGQRLDAISDAISSVPAQGHADGPSSDEVAAAVSDRIAEALPSAIAGALASEGLALAARGDGQQVAGDDAMDRVVRRLKDAIVTDGNKTRTAVDRALSSVSSLPDSMRGISEEAARAAVGGAAPDAQALDEAMSEVSTRIDELSGSIGDRIDGLSRMMASQPSNIVFDEATSRFFRELYVGVSNLLERMGGVEAGIEQAKAAAVENGVMIDKLSLMTESLSDGLPQPQAAGPEPVADAVADASADAVADAVPAPASGISWGRGDAGARGHDAVLDALSSSGTTFVGEDLGEAGWLDDEKDGTADGDMVDGGDEGDATDGGDMAGVGDGAGAPAPEALPPSGSLMDDVLRNITDGTPVPASRMPHRISIPERRRVSRAEREREAAEAARKPVDPRLGDAPASRHGGASTGRLEVDRFIDSLDLSSIGAPGGEPSGQLLDDVLGRLLG